VLAAVLVLAAGGRLSAQPPEGSQLAADENNCATCHGEEALWEGETARLFISPESLAEDIHFQIGVNCHDCHGGDPSTFDVPEAHSVEVEPGATVEPFRSPLGEIWNACGNCHKDARLGLAKGVHAKAGERDARDRGLALGCNKCHGEKAHGMLPVGDIRSPVFLDHQVRTCGGCHEEDLETYNYTVHGEGLTKSGLSVTAVCADCHGAHGIYYAADKRSTLHSTNVAATCGACHKFLEERIARSVHGHGAGPGAESEMAAPGGLMKRRPSCTSCHQGHHLLDPESEEFQLELANLCGNCHADLSSRYTMSVHGELTQLGYVAAAQCADCHGAHEIQAVDAAASSVAPGKKRLETCRNCHDYAVASFADFDPHANHKDEVRYPRLHAVYAGMHALINWGFILFAIHAFLWFLRALVHTLQHGRHKTLVTAETALMKVPPVHRILYGLLLISFLGLVLTGLPLKYGSQPWARSLAANLGGFDSTSFSHHFFAVVALFVCGAQVVRLFGSVAALRREKQSWKEIVSGPDSLLPRWRDLRDLGGMLRWFLGLGRRPVFERWTYWEKLDVWMFTLGAAMIAGSGLMLWYPNVFCRVLPGATLNLAKVVHSELAILVASFLFLVHFYHAHFRPEKFPMDLSVLTGLVSEEHLRKHRPEYVGRLERSGRLEAMRCPAPSSRRLRGILLAGFLVFALGLCMLALILLASLGK
jgi:cytochrome b subunit of formate dehydrogenase